MKQRLYIGKKHFIAVKLEDGSITYNRKLILTIVEEYYSKLYKESSPKQKTTAKSILSQEDAPDILPEKVRYANKNTRMENLLELIE